MTKRPEKSSHFSIEEQLIAQRQFDALFDEHIESPGEYMERKRSRDMQRLVRLVVENELDSRRVDVFSRAFFYGEKISDIAENMGISLSAAYKYYDSAVRTISDSLKYVLIYQNITVQDVMMPLQKMRDSAFIASNGAYSNAFPLRLSRLMERENVSKDKLCSSLDLNRNRFGKIFVGKLEPVAGEIVLISGFFGVSTDYILKGDKS